MENVLSFVHLSLSAPSLYQWLHLHETCMNNLGGTDAPILAMLVF